MSQDRLELPREETFRGVADHRIFYRWWEPEGAPRAVVVVSHGFNSHSGHYLEVGSRLAEAGMAVYALDHRGRGRSDGERYYVEHYADYATDLRTMIRIAKERHPGLPVFLLGHSAGGVIACGFTLDHQEEIAGLICESFAFRVPAPDFALAVLKGLSHVAPHARVLRLKLDDFSRIPEVRQALHDDPLVADEVQPTRTVAEMVRADERLEREFGRITLPVFILHGTADRVTRPEGSQQFYDSVGSTDRTLRLYEGHAHDLLNDLGKEEVLADILSWIEERIPGTRRDALRSPEA